MRLYKLFRNALKKHDSEVRGTVTSTAFQLALDSRSERRTATTRIHESSQELRGDDHALELGRSRLELGSSSPEYKRQTKTSSE